MSEFQRQPTAEGFKLVGELTFVNAGTVLQTMSNLPATQHTIVLDLSQLTAVDSAGLSVFLHWARLATQQNNALSLINASEQLTALISICGLSDILSFA